MHSSFERPKDKESIDDREAKGLWEALILSREIGESTRTLDLSVIKDIHRKILSKSMPECSVVSC